MGEGNQRNVRMKIEQRQDLQPKYLRSYDYTAPGNQTPSALPRGALEA